jgi:hypothetical protein
MKIDNTKTWTEGIIEENCSKETFYKVADLDSIYWDFIYEQRELTLHYNNYIGVSIFPKALKNAVDLSVLRRVFFHGFCAQAKGLCGGGVKERLKKRIYA